MSAVRLIKLGKHTAQQLQSYILILTRLINIITFLNLGAPKQLFISTFTTLNVSLVNYSHYIGLAFILNGMATLDKELIDI